MTKTKRDRWTRVEIGVFGSDATHHLSAFIQRAPRPASSSSSSSRTPPPFCYAHPVATSYRVAAAPACTPVSDRLHHHTPHPTTAIYAAPSTRATRLVYVPAPYHLISRVLTVIPTSRLCRPHLWPSCNCARSATRSHLTGASPPHRAAGQAARASGLAQRPSRRCPSHRAPCLSGHALRLRPRPRPWAGAGRSSLRRA
jgi:hypothetical protein